MIVGWFTRKHSIAWAGVSTPSTLHASHQNLSAIIRSQLIWTPVWFLMLRIILLPSGPFSAGSHNARVTEWVACENPCLTGCTFRSCARCRRHRTRGYVRVLMDQPINFRSPRNQHPAAKVIARPKNGTAACPLALLLQNCISD
jgi:hypothetical protein